jgi:hypothetical protein
MNTSDVICLESKAFYSLVEEVVERLGEKYKLAQQDEWVDGDEAMRLLRISSKTTIQKLRDEGKIRFSQPEKKIILYDRNSLYEYLEKHARETF